MIGTGKLNLITDVAGLSVGNAADAHVRTGVTAILCDKPAIASVHVMGGAPGTRETDLLSPANTVERINAIVLSGGSAFGLDAASGVQAALREQGKGFELRGHVVPIVPSAILFDLANGGAKDWGTWSPYRELGYSAALSASTDFDTGTAGAGYGCLVSGLKGGLGSASTKLENGTTVAALAAVNALGNVTVGSTRHFWSAPFEVKNEFGGFGLPAPMPVDAKHIKVKFRDSISPLANTTIGVIATDATLTKGQANRLAIAAHDGYARAIWPSHTPMDGDVVFALATGGSEIVPQIDDWIDISACAASTMARAIARAVYNATPMEGDIYPAWREKFTT